MRYIVKSKDGKYLTNRRNNGKMYESRVTWNIDNNEAKVFQTKGAATNSANRISSGFKVIPVDIVPAGLFAKFKKALTDIAAPRSCGCTPVCHCNSAEYLELEVEGIKRLAEDTLTKVV